MTTAGRTARVSRRSTSAAPPVLVEVTRAGRVESVHRGSIAVVAPDGSSIASVGDPEQFVYARSCSKPFQLAPFVASGRFDEYGLGTDALAIMAASHSGEDRKSTRLNSSHGYISYAVFCLKKKTTSYVNTH